VQRKAVQTQVDETMLEVPRNPRSRYSVGDLFKAIDNEGFVLISLQSGGEDGHRPRSCVARWPRRRHRTRTPMPHGERSLECPCIFADGLHELKSPQSGCFYFRT
jgi:hypothetical protein